MLIAPFALLVAGAVAIHVEESSQVSKESLQQIVEALRVKAAPRAQPGDALIVTVLGGLKRIRIIVVVTPVGQRAVTDLAVDGSDWERALEQLVVQLFPELPQVVAPPLPAVRQQAIMVHEPSISPLVEWTLLGAGVAALAGGTVVELHAESVANGLPSEPPGELESRSGSARTERAVALAMVGTGVVLLVADLAMIVLDGSGP